MKQLTSRIKEMWVPVSQFDLGRQQCVFIMNVRELNNFHILLPMGISILRYMDGEFSPFTRLDAS